jgi:hypothetical protein
MPSKFSILSRTKRSTDGSCSPYLSSGRSSFLPYPEKDHSLSHGIGASSSVALSAVPLAADMLRQSSTPPPDITSAGPPALYIVPDITEESSNALPELLVPSSAGVHHAVNEQQILRQSNSSPGIPSDASPAANTAPDIVEESSNALPQHHVPSGTGVRQEADDPPDGKSKSSSHILSTALSTIKTFLEITRESSSVLPPLNSAAGGFLNVIKQFEVSFQASPKLLREPI